MKNERGSVLSVAVVIIFLISFAVSVTTVYTADVMNRTNVIVGNNDENIFARRIIRTAIDELKQEVQGLDDFSGGFTITNTENLDIQGIMTDLQSLIQTYYFSIGRGDADTSNTLTIVYNEDELPTDVLVFTVSYRTLAGNVIRRNLLIEPSTTVGNGGGEGTTMDNFEDVITNFLECEFEDGSNVCLNTEFDYRDPTDSTFMTTFFEVSGGFRHGELDQNAHIDGNLHLWATASGQNTSLDFDGHLVVVTGDLTLREIHRIKSPDDRPTLIIVGGNLTLIGEHDIDIDNVIILVQGWVELDFQGRGNSNNFTLTMNDSHIFSLNTWDHIPSYLKDRDDTYFSERFYNPDYRYLGSDPTYTFGDLTSQFPFLQSSQFSFIFIVSGFDVTGGD